MTITFTVYLQRALSCMRWLNSVDNEARARSTHVYKQMSVHTYVRSKSWQPQHQGQQQQPAASTSAACRHYQAST
jgi:hypothetical protein